MFIVHCSPEAVNAIETAITKHLERLCDEQTIISSPGDVYIVDRGITISTTVTSDVTIDSANIDYIINPIYEYSYRDYPTKIDNKNQLFWQNKMLSKSTSKKLHKKVNRHYINVRNRI